MPAIMTTYDFKTKTFGHATMLIGNYFEIFIPDFDVTIEEIQKAREKVLKGVNKKEYKREFGKYLTGPGHIFNESPTNEEESLQHGNALAASGNYPVGTSGCFNVGISGGCGPDCFVYKKGECPEPQEMRNKYI